MSVPSTEQPQSFQPGRTTPRHVAVTVPFPPESLNVPETMPVVLLKASVAERALPALSSAIVLLPMVTADEASTPSANRNMSVES